MPQLKALCPVIACMIALPLASTMIGSQTAEPVAKPPISLGISTRQGGAPVKIVAAKSTLEYLYEQITLKNASANTVASVSFGVLLYPEGLTNSNPTLVRAPAIRTQIKPGEERTLDAYMLPLAHAYEEMGRVGQDSATAQTPSKIRAVIGLLHVEFLDASPWDFDPQTQRGFDSSAPPSASQDSGECTESTTGGVFENAAASLTGYFTCVSADYCLYCENHVTYCITRKCPLPPGAICDHSNDGIGACRGEGAARLSNCITLGHREVQRPVERCPSVANRGQHMGRRATRDDLLSFA